MVSNPGIVALVIPAGALAGEVSITVRTCRDATSLGTLHPELLGALCGMATIAAQRPSPRSAARTAGARRIRKAYDADLLICSRCRSPRKVIVQAGSSAKHCESPPPGLDPASLD